MATGENDKKLFGGKVPTGLIDEFKVACDINGCILERAVESAMRVWVAIPASIRARLLLCDVCEDTGKTRQVLDDMPREDGESVPFVETGGAYFLRMIDEQSEVIKTLTKTEQQGVKKLCEFMKKSG